MSRWPRCRNVVVAKLGAWSDETRRPNKRRKDELDFLRLAEAFPIIVDPLLPAELRRKAQEDRAQIEAHPDDNGWGTTDEEP